MTKDDKNRVIKALVEFVERATQKDATATELEALPAVASILEKIRVIPD